MRQADLVKRNLVWMEEHSLKCLLTRAEGVGSYQLGPALTNLFQKDLPGRNTQIALTLIKLLMAYQSKRSMHTEATLIEWHL